MNVSAPPDPGLVGSTRFLAGSGAFVVAAGAGLGFLRFVADEPYQGVLERAAGATAMAAVVAAPGVLALLARRGRPVLLLPAGIVLGPLSRLSFAGLTLPLLVPAVIFLVAYGRLSPASPTRRGESGLATAGMVMLLITAAAALFVHADPRSYSTPTHGGSTSDVITLAEALISIALVVTTIVGGWAVSAPRALRRA